MSQLRIIDGHLHCGVQNVTWDWERVRPLLAAAGIQGVGVIPPVEDVYDRYNPSFTDTPAWQACRRRAHQYLLDLKNARGRGPGGPPQNSRRTPGCAPMETEIEIYPYFFVWNDFAWQDLGPEFVAIKWHRHPDEPEYQYADPRCREFLEVARQRRLPILLEESFENTMFFLEKLAGDLPVIIPHLGGLSGGYANLLKAGVWDSDSVYADSALAWPGEIEDFLNRYGPERLLFGSDHPFGQPRSELAKILNLGLPENQIQAILGDNFRRLCGLE
jgi:hypothetical protein